MGPCTQAPKLPPCLIGGRCGARRASRGGADSLGAYVGVRVVRSRKSVTAAVNASLLSPATM